jgi:hypothetical protein
VLISLGRLLRCNVPVAFAAAPNFAGSSTDANPLSVHHWRSRRIAVLSVCRRGEAQELRGSFRRRSFGGNGHAWVDDIERGEIIRSDGSAVDGLRRHCSVLLCSRCDLEIQIGRGSGGDLSHCGVDGLRGGSLVRAVAITAMRVHFDISALKDTKWYEYALRFFFGGAITVITGVLANRYGPVFGGLFLAFPAVFPGSATLIEKHRARKETEGGNRKDASRARGRSFRCARRCHREHWPHRLRIYDMAAAADLERRTRTFWCARGVDDGVDSNLAFAQAPSFPPQRPD